MIVKTIRLSVGPMSIQEGVRLLLDIFSSTKLRRNHETLDTSIHFAILESWPSIERFKFRNQQGFSARKHSRYFLAETSGLTSSEFASVLATSGTTGAEGESIGNSWKFSHLVEALSAQ